MPPVLIPVTKQSAHVQCGPGGPRHHASVDNEAVVPHEPAPGTAAPGTALHPLEDHHDPPTPQLPVGRMRGQLVLLRAEQPGHVRGVPLARQRARVSESSIPDRWPAPVYGPGAFVKLLSPSQ